MQLAASNCANVRAPGRTPRRPVSAFTRPPALLRARGRTSAAAAAAALPRGTDALVDFEGRYGNGSRSLVPEEVLAELDEEERRTVTLYQSASRSVVNITTTATPFPLFPLNIQVIGRDREKDVAVLLLDLPRARAAALHPVTLGSSTNLLIGQKVFAIGNPFALDTSLTQGIVSGLGRELPTSPTGVPITNVIQTDAAVNPGNSGGVLLDSKGRLVGIPTAIIDPTGRGSNSGVGFAIPIDAVKGLVDQILTYGRVMRPYLGISLLPASVTRGVSPPGVMVMSVAPNSPASRAGLQATRWWVGRVEWGDVITGVNGVRVRNEKELLTQLDLCAPNQEVEVTVERARPAGEAARSGGGASDGERTLRVLLAERSSVFGDS